MSSSKTTTVRIQKQPIQMIQICRLEHGTTSDYNITLGKHSLADPEALGVVQYHILPTFAAC